MKKHTLFIVLIISVALGIGMWRDNHETQVAQVTVGPVLSAGSALPQPQKLPPFHLQHMEGKPFTPEDLKNHWSFLFFGYSHCSGICPATLGALKQVSQRLRGGQLVQFLFVTIDPEHDTPEQLKTYLQGRFDPSFIGITGQKEEIHHLAKEIGIHFAKDKDIDPQQHIEHSGAILLINPEGKLAAIFTNSEKPHAIAHDFKQIAHYYAQG